MADLGFEARLERMYAEAPAFRDGDLFALRVAERLDRGWTARRLLIGVMGLAGGMIGSAQILGSGAIGQIHALGAQSDRFLNDRLLDVLPDNLLPPGFALNTDVLWMTLGLAVVAIGFGIARAIREI
ncbi:MAG: hypothetical protein ACHP84_11875 [Caulobacterales bacterium]